MDIILPPSWSIASITKELFRIKQPNDTFKGYLLVGAWATKAYTYVAEKQFGLNIPDRCLGSFATAQEAADALITA